jgi:hypothetical protein
MKLKTWLDAERGRSAALAAHLALTAGRISQMAADGVPVKFMQVVSAFTGGEVSITDMVDERTPDARQAEAV